MDSILMLKKTVNKKEILRFSKKNIFYSYFTLCRWCFLAVGHWPNQNKMCKFVSSTTKAT